MPSNPDPSNSGKFSRPIDAPSLPPWSRAAEERTPHPALVPAPAPPEPSDDETPTLSGDAFPVTAVLAAEGLAAEAPAAPTPRPDDPRELARRLAQEAKQKALARKEEEPMRTDDPRELARRLAEEAKRRLNPSAAPPPPAPDPEPSITAWDQPVVSPDFTTDPGEYDAVAEPSLPVFRDQVFPRGDEPLVDEPSDGGPTDGDGFDGPAADDPDPEPPPDLPTQFARGRSLAERAAGTQPRQGMSAMEALAAARLAEAQAKKPQAAAPAPRPAAQPAPRPVAPAAQPAAARPAAPVPGTVTVAQPAPRPRAVADPADAASVFAELLPGASVEPPIQVSQLDVFRALWRAHRARAQHDQVIELVATASVLLDAAERGAHLAAARVTMGGATWAAWIDLDRRVLLGVAKPAEVYLAGL